MKTPKKSPVNKLIVRFDNELKDILMRDLLAIRTTRLINAIHNNRLNAA